MESAPKQRLIGDESMEKKNSVLVICETLAPEIEGKVPAHVKIEVIEFRFHLYPKKLNEQLQSILNTLDRQGLWNEIILGFGFCSDGVVGLKSKKSKIIIPKADDCIALLLGSTEAYRRELLKEPGTYYLTKGWIDQGGDPLAVFDCKHEWTRNYDKKTAEWFAREMIKNYSRVGLIDTGSYDLGHYAEYSKKVAATFGLKLEIISGTTTFLERLLYGPWDETFIVLEPGQEIRREMFAPQN